MVSTNARRSDGSSLTRRAFLGATALVPAACMAHGGASTAGSSGAEAPAEIPPARRAGTPPPDVEALLARMTLDEKIGQMTQIDRGALKHPDGAEIREFFIGSVLSGADSLPTPNLPETWVAMVDGFQNQALSTRLAIPLLYGIDAVHGDGGVKGSVIFPHEIGLGCTRSPELVEAVCRATAEEVAGVGIDWTFAPCLAVPRDERWGRTYEGFGETPELVASLGAAAVRGYEQAPGGAAILATAKHYLADGGTSGGKDRGDAAITEDELRRIHLPGYEAAIKAGVGSVMVSFSSWNGKPMHGNRHLITTVLKEELGFSGFTVTDWAAIDLMSPDYKKDVEVAINAGIDMVMVPIRYRDFITSLKELVMEGRVSEARIDDAVRRILEQKVRFGLWQRPFTDRAWTAKIGSPEHRAVARDAARRSLVLLKNDGGVLPLRKEARVHVCGFRADDMGVQCGGWSVGWRGRRGAITTVGATIRRAIEAVVGPGRIDFSKDAVGAERADAVVVVVGEDPYAEGFGDRAELLLTVEDRTLVAAAKRSGKPVVVVLLSGRAMILGEIADEANAIVAAWLPGTEGGAGLADVLYGAVKPTGKLSCSWPRDMTQVPINVGDAGYHPLYEYGFGLTW